MEEYSISSENFKTPKEVIDIFLFCCSYRILKTAVISQ